MMTITRIMKIRLILAIISLIAVIGVGFVCYFKFYVKTPQYTIKSISTAINKHELSQFNKYVDEDALLNSLSDDIINGMLDMQNNVPDDAKVAMANFANMFKAPLIASLQNGINTYVQTGSWTSGEDVKDQQGAMINSDQILSQIGITQITDAKLEDIDVNKDAHLAVANILVTQSDLAEPFLMKVVLTEQADGYWRVTKIENFTEFIAAIKQARLQSLKEYLDNSSTGIASDQKILLDNEAKFNLELHAGSLGNNEFRQSLHKQIDSTIIPNLKKIQETLQSMQVPTIAKPLHNLRLNIYKHKILYYQDYSKWLLDKNIKNLREATDNLQIAQNLENDASLLTKRMQTQISDTKNN